MSSLGPPSTRTTTAVTTASGWTSTTPLSVTASASTCLAQAHTNGIESFWALLKRGYYGTYHRMRPKHLQRYVDEFADRHNMRPLDTIDQMKAMVRGMDGKRLRYRDLVG